MVSWLLKGADIADGLGNPLYRGDVLVANGRIRLLTPDEPVAATRVLDARGLVLAPGFIDIHSHNDLVAASGVYLGDKVSQGVTTEVVGNCGFSAFPITDCNRGLLGELLGIIAPGEWLPRWLGWQQYANELEVAGSQTNLMGQVGHAMVRSAVMGMEYRAPTAGELDAMQRLLAENLEQGAAGFSLGLMYHPSGFAEGDEIRALCEVAADRDAFVSVHLRSYDHHGLMTGIEEMVEVAELTGVRLQLSHLSPTGRRGQGLAFDMLAYVDAAVARGVSVAFDRYPYETAYSRLSLLFPQWSLAGGEDAIAERFANDLTLAKILLEVDRFAADIGYESIVFNGEGTQEYCGKSLRDIAEAEGIVPSRCAANILRELGTSAAITLALSRMDTQKRVLSHRLCMIGSDGVPCRGGTHPRTFGTFSRVLGPLVRDGDLSLPVAVHKMSGQPAAWLGLRDRGRIAANAVADLVLFDPETIADQATFAAPYAFSSGIKAVFVAGEPVLMDGALTERRPGKALARPPSAGAS